MSSNPITSVPDPSGAEGGGNSGSSAKASDPLASVITQVSPGQAAAPGALLAGRGAGPARPQKVAKPGTAKAAAAAEQRKKKKKTPTGGAAAPGGAGSGAKEGETTEGDAGSSAAGAASGTDKIEDATASATHSQDPSSTLIGTTSTIADKPSKIEETPTEPNPKAAASPVGAGAVGDGQQDMTTAAEKVTTDKSTKQGTSATKKASKPTTKPRKLTLGQKVIAFLTCSSGAAAMADDDDRADGQLRSRKGKGQSATEKTGDTRKQNGKATAIGAGGVKKGRGTKLAAGKPTSSRTSSQRASVDKGAIGAPGTVTPGGGTRLPREETGDVMSGAVVPPGSSFVVHDADGEEVTPQPSPGKRGLGLAAGAGAGAGALGGVAAGEIAAKGDSDDDDEEGDDEDWMADDMDLDDDQTEEQRLIMQGGMGIPRDEEGNEHPLLDPIVPEDHGRKCLVLDLDETLVHSSFKMISNADFIVPVEIEGTVHNVYVIKRPGVDEFMRRMGEVYEVVVFTASLSKYADPVLDILDIHHVVRHRLFRESCYNHKGNYVKDLSQLGRDIGESIIIDNSPASYIFHPNNAVPISSWFNDPHDTELTDLVPFLRELADVDDVRAVLDGGL